MRNAVTSAVCKRKNAEPQILLKRIGSTNYIVSVHFSQSGKETLEEKLLRLMECGAKHNA